MGLEERGQAVRFLLAWAIRLGKVQKVPPSEV
jgi:hypothetical protein